jgi:3-phytase
MRELFDLPKNPVDVSVLLLQASKEDAVRTASHRWVITCLGGVALAAVFSLGQEKAVEVKPVLPQVKCLDQDAKDQDDMCIWVHPTDPAQSTLIASDKKANKLFDYDLAGNTLQSLPAQHPGNIDVRYGFPLGGQKVDIVALNQRDDPRILVYQVDGKSRQLQRVDNDSIRTGENYGGTLYRSPKTGRFFFLTTSETGVIEQYELADDGTGKVAGKKVRSWRIGKSEAAVADDEAGKVYIGEESKGVWEVGGEPDDPTPGKLVIKLGENGLTGDVEGLAIYPLPGGAGYLIVSNQGRNNFKVYQRAGAHEFVGTFAVQGANKTDGLDVCNASLGPHFPKGLFASHTAEGGCPVLLTPWDAIARGASSSLHVDTSWDRRK